jgi:hypothetical protein
MPKRIPAKGKLVRRTSGAVILCAWLFVWLPNCQGFTSHAGKSRPARTSSERRSSVEPEGTTEKAPKKRTLYGVLGASPLETREELKKHYIRMAKESHPDAQIGKTGTDPAPDFAEIAAAWNLLGDPKARRAYDRNLQAEEFSEKAQKFANERLERAVPVVANVIDKFASPFLRRTTATTWAAAQAAAKSAGINAAFFDAIEAGQRAGKFIDALELQEKVSELAERYVHMFLLNGIWCDLL